MGMSYKRAWSLVQSLNEGFGAPLVETQRGGAGQGGAAVTAAGHEVLKRYRHMQERTRTAIALDVKALGEFEPICPSGNNACLEPTAIVMFQRT